MLPFKIVFDDSCRLPIGNHIFPADKYARTQQRLLELGAAAPEDFVSGPAATDEDIMLVHTRMWVDKLAEGQLTVREELELEVPYSLELVKAFWQITGNSMLAANLALRDGCCVHLGGGFHHAFAGHGEGFCVIHDVAVAIRALQRDGKIARAMVIDTDVHQGNGTATIFGDDKLRPFPRPAWSAEIVGPSSSAKVKQGGSRDVFTISLHQETNYPEWKPESSIDVNLPDGINDAEYLDWLRSTLKLAQKRFQPELICHLSGADAYQHDQLGGLGLTIEGLRRRDAMVYEFARDLGCPVMVTLAGGYAEKLEDTVAIHANTVLVGIEVFR